MPEFNFYKPHRVETIKELVEYGAEAYSERPVFQYEEKKKAVSVSYGEFAREVAKLSAFFIGEGYHGSHIAILGENSFEWILTGISVICSGNVLVPVDKELSASEIYELLKQSDCTSLIFSKSYADIGESDAFSGLKLYCMSDIEHMLTEGQTLLESNVGKYTYTPDKDDIAMIVFTSGTTGKHKGVMLSHMNLAIDSYGAACNVLMEGTSLFVLPLHHTFAWVTLCFDMLRGNTIYINRSLKRLADDFSKCKPHHMMAVPLLIENLSENIWMAAKAKNKTILLRFEINISKFLRMFGKDMRKKMFESVRKAFGGELEYIVSGGAPIKESTLNTLENFGVTILNGYGITECSPIVAVTMTNNNVPGSVGVPLVCNEVRIAEDDEILVKGSNVMRGYYRDEESTRMAFDGEWFRTGDLGRFDENGMLYITGRKKNLIILSNGENIPAEELESAILSVPYVLEAVVTGENDVITASVYLDPDYPEAKDTIFNEIQKLNRKLPHNRNISKIIVREEPFPKTSTKKIKR